jgi:hypothetical protein
VQHVGICGVGVTFPQRAVNCNRRQRSSWLCKFRYSPPYSNSLSLFSQCRLLLFRVRRRPRPAKRGAALKVWTSSSACIRPTPSSSSARGEENCYVSVRASSSCRKTGCRSDLLLSCLVRLSGAFSGLYLNSSHNGLLLFECNDFPLARASDTLSTGESRNSALASSGFSLASVSFTSTLLDMNTGCLSDIKSIISSKTLPSSIRCGEPVLRSGISLS